MSDSPLFRVLLILMIVSLLGALLFFMYSLATMSSPASGPARREVQWQGGQSETAFRAAAEEAESRAQAWAADAALVRAEGSWRPGKTWAQVETPPIAWVFTFYSAEMGKVATVSVSDEGVHRNAPERVEAVPTTVSPFPPPQGPDIAWLSFRSYGGETFLKKYPDAMVKLLLKQEGPDPQWVVSALNPPDHIRVPIDAATGARASDG